MGDHPALGELLRRMADICRVGALLDPNDVYRMLVTARERAYTYHIKAAIGISLGTYLDQNNASEQAYAESNQSFRIMTQLYGEEDPKTQEAKTAMLAVKRKFVQARVEAQKSQQEALEKRTQLLKEEYIKKQTEALQKTQQSEIAKRRYKQALRMPGAGLAVVKGSTDCERNISIIIYCYIITIRYKANTFI